MTLIVGIKCKEGIALGADGAATYGVLGTPTIRQSVKKKLRLMGSQVVVGVSGPVGLGQRIAGEIEALQKLGIPIDQNQRKLLSTCKPYEALGFMRHLIWSIVGQELEIARTASQAIGACAFQSALAQTIAALLVANEPCLFSFDQQGSGEQATDDLPFVAIGSGQLIADPFLAFIRRIFWKDQVPTLEQGVFAACWAIQHAIHTNAGGVGPPIQIVTFSKGKDGAKPIWQAQEMLPETNDERLQFIDVLEKKIAELPNIMMDKKSADAPMPPK
jgi:20S proteasome alpha/beta subunit